ncbi:MAG: hypothetical protein R2806_23355 [Saprospiraceae bacterium]
MKIICDTDQEGAWMGGDQVKMDGAASGMLERSTPEALVIVLTG